MTGRRAITGDGGSASLYLLGIGLCVLLLSSGFAVVGSAMVARHRAQAAADFGALAGALQAVNGSAAACSAAAGIVAQNGARISGCVVGVALDVTVGAEVDLRGGWGTARARARAGPDHTSAAPGADHTSAGPWPDHPSAGQGADHTSAGPWPDHTSAGQGADHTSARRWPHHPSAGQGADHTGAGPWPDHPSTGQGADHTSGGAVARPPERRAGPGTGRTGCPEVALSPYYGARRWSGRSRSGDLGRVPARVPGPAAAPGG